MGFAGPAPRNARAGSRLGIIERRERAPFFKSLGNFLKLFGAIPLATSAELTGTPMKSRLISFLAVGTLAAVGLVHGTPTPTPTPTPARLKVKATAVVA